LPIKSPIEGTAAALCGDGTPLTALRR